MSMGSSFRSGRKHKLKAEINVVPFIDVMLVLLIIFMITAPLIQQGIEVKLPKTSPESTKALDQNKVKAVVVTVDADNKYYIANQLVDIAAIKDIVSREKQKNPSVKVLVKGDKASLHGTYVELIDILKAEFGEVGIITDKRAEKK